MKVAKEVQIAIKGALVAAKMSLIPVRRGYWGNKIGKVHTVPMKITGKCGSVRVRLIPAPRGTAIVGAPTSKKLLQFAGVEDVFTSTKGSTKTLENFVRATFEALKKTYGFLTPDLWPTTQFVASPFIRFWKRLEAPQDKKRAVDGERRPRGGPGRGRGGPGRGGRGEGRGRGEPRGDGERSGRGRGRGRAQPQPEGEEPAQE